MYAMNFPFSYDERVFGLFAYKNRSCEFESHFKAEFR